LKTQEFTVKSKVACDNYPQEAYGIAAVVGVVTAFICCCFLSSCGAQCRFLWSSPVCHHH